LYQAAILQKKKRCIHIYGHILYILYISIYVYIYLYMFIYFMYIYIYSYMKNCLPGIIELSQCHEELSRGNAVCLWAIVL